MSKQINGPALDPNNDYPQSAIPKSLEEQLLSNNILLRTIVEQNVKIITYAESIFHFTIPPTYSETYQEANRQEREDILNRMTEVKTQSEFIRTKIEKLKNG